MILEFLAELLYKGYKYRAIGVYRSKISNFHQPTGGVVIAKHPSMSKFMKGIFYVSFRAQILCHMGCEPGLECSENMGPSGKVNPVSS